MTFPDSHHNLLSGMLAHLRLLNASGGGWTMPAASRVPYGLRHYVFVG